MEKVKFELKLKKRRPKNAVQGVVDAYLHLRGWADKPKDFYKKMKINYGRLCREAKILLEVMGGLDEALRVLSDMEYKAKKVGCEWSICTIYKPDLKINLRG